MSFARCIVRFPITVITPWRCQLPKARHVSTVNLGNLLSESHRDSAIDTLRQACSHEGYALLDIPDSIVSASKRAQVYQHLHDFHALPLAVKQQYHASLSKCSRGWTPQGEEPAYEAGTASVVEAFDLSTDLAPDHPAVLAQTPEIGPNVYPAELDGFKEDVYGYYCDMSVVSRLLFGAFERLLDLKHGALLSRSTELSRSTMRLLRYGTNQARAVDIKKHNTGISMHTDFECFTVIHQSAPGLQVSRRDGGWDQIDTVKHVLLIGDMIERLSNGTYVATPHRVAQTSWERTSIVRFNGLDGHEVVEPLPQFVSQKNPAQYEPISQDQNICHKVEAALANLADEAP